MGSNRGRDNSVIEVMFIWWFSGKHSFLFPLRVRRLRGWAPRGWRLWTALETAAYESQGELQGEPRRGPWAAGGLGKDEEPWFKLRPLLVDVAFLCYKWSCKDGHGIYPGQGLLCGSQRKQWGCWGYWLTWWSRVHRHYRITWLQNLLVHLSFTEHKPPGGRAFFSTVIPPSSQTPAWASESDGVREEARGSSSREGWEEGGEVGGRAWMSECIFQGWPVLGMTCSGPGVWDGVEVGWPIHLGWPWVFWLNPSSSALSFLTATESPVSRAPLSPGSLGLLVALCFVSKTRAPLRSPSVRGGLWKLQDRSCLQACVFFWPRLKCVWFIFSSAKGSFFFW